METYRLYGSAPFTAAVVHGGPGAAGEMAPVARESARIRGTLEPLQTATSLAGQVDDLRATLESNASPPVMLIGFSWGAWLSYIVAALHRGEGFQTVWGTVAEWRRNRGLMELGRQIRCPVVA